VKSILHIELDGQHWEYEQGSLMYQEAKVFQIQIGMTVGQWENGLNTGDISCLAALWWLCRQRDGERLKFDDMEFNVQDFMAGITERDEHGNEIVRNKAGDVEKLIAPDLDRREAAIWLTAAEVYGIQRWDFRRLTFAEFEQLERSCMYVQAEAAKHAK
jgi:hypothetical protein